MRSKGLAERVRVHAPASRGGEHPAGIVDADRGVLGGLQRPPSGEDLEGGGVEVDAAPGIGGLAA